MTLRRRYEFVGRVQGVGFRPAVARLAWALELSGYVVNRGGDVVAEVEGPPDRVERFHASIAELPGRIDSIGEHDADPVGDDAFVVLTSDVGVGMPAITVDTAPCSACVLEFEASGGRRSGYVFTSCAACGPRYAITRSLPWDRHRTSMHGFPRCDECEAEYRDPGDRRFHAETTCCPRCGPTLVYRTGDEPAVTADAALAAAVDVLERGDVILVKGIGGFHLCCRADDEGAVQRIREAKARDAKPLAILVPDLAAARALAEVDEPTAVLLADPARPIVLAPRRDRRGVLAEAVAPGMGDLGVLLPASLTQLALVRRVGRPLVLTSANHSGAPVATTAEELDAAALAVASAVLDDDRPIARRADDAVVRTSARGPIPIRVGRGTSPLVLDLPRAVPEPVLAVGGHLKTTIAIASGARVVVSPHLGDQDHPRSVDAFAEAIDALEALVGISPAIVATDAHPDAGPTQWAASSGRHVIPVQHHHAHLAATFVDPGCTAPVVGIVCDGFGLGPDGTAWGGEVLRATCDSPTAERLSHLLPVPLPGGDAAARDPWRMAVVWAGTVDDSWARSMRDGAAILAAAAAPTTMHTSSLGRLFDAVACLLGVTRRNRFEGDAAMQLEAIAMTSGTPAPAPPFGVGDVIDPRPFLSWLRAHPGEPGEDVALAFHHRLAEALASSAAPHAAPVALTGGVFQNRLLVELTSAALESRGTTVLPPGRIPPNDAGLSVGQIVVASATLVS